MSRVPRFYPRAREDLLDQAVYLADNASIETSDRFLIAAEQTVKKLAEMPRVGKVWTGLENETREGLRVWSVDGFPKILIFYQLEEQRVAVVRVLHGARDLPGVLDDLDV